MPGRHFIQPAFLPGAALFEVQSAVNDHSLEGIVQEVRQTSTSQGYALCCQGLGLFLIFDVDRKWRRADETRRVRVD